MLSLILSYHSNLGKRFFEEHRLSRIIIMGISLAFGILVAVGLYTLFLGGISYIETQNFVGRALLEYMYQSFFLIVAFAVWVSTIIFFLFRVAKSDVDSWIIASPNATMLPLYWAGLAIVLSLPIVIAIVPELFAANSFYGFSMSDWILGVLAVDAFLFAIIGTSLATIALLMRILQFLSILSLRSLILSVSFISILFLAAIGYVTVGQDTTEIFQAEIISIDQADPERVTQSFAWTPGYPMAKVLLLLHKGNSILALAWLCALYSLASASFAIYWIIMKTSLLSIWTDLRASNHANSHPRSTFPSFGDSLSASIAEKEFLAIIRNKKDILWTGFVALLWILTMGMARRAPTITLETIIEQDRFIVYGVWGVSVYFTFLIFLRFVFTTFVYDQPFQWLMLSSPVSQLKVYRGKLILFFIGGLLLLITLTSISAWIISLPLTLYYVLLIFSLLAVSLGVTLATFLGAAFLKTSRTHISRDQASSSLPGLLYVLFTSVWSVIAILVLEEGLTQNSWSAFIVLIIVSLLGALLNHILTETKVRALHTE